MALFEATEWIAGVGPNASNLLATPATIAGARGGKSSGVVYDGNHKTVLAVGAPLVSRPFGNEGDSATKIIRQRVQQNLQYRTALPNGTLYNYPDEPVYTAMHRTAMLFDESEPRDLGGNIGEWVRLYATLPPTRRVPQSHLFSYQTFSTGDGTSFTLGSVTMEVASKLVYEYFLYKDIAAYPLLQAPRVVPVGQNQYRILPVGSMVASSTIYGVFNSTTDDFIAESSVYETWHYPIMCRKTRYVPPPTDAFWGAEFALPSPPASP